MSIESRYRIGMAHYLMRKYDDAIRAFADSLALDLDLVAGEIDASAAAVVL